MKKLITTLTTLVALMIFAGYAYAGNPFENFFTGIAKGVGGAVYHVVMTPANMVTGAQEDGVTGFITGFGDITRAPVKLVEEVGYGLTFQATDLPIEDPGAWNNAIEDNTVAHALRNGAGTYAATAGIVGLDHSWFHTWRAATAVGVVTGAGTALNH